MIRTALAVASVAAIALGVCAALAQQDPVKERKALMKEMGQQAKIGGDMIKGDARSTCKRRTAPPIARPHPTPVKLFSYVLASQMTSHETCFEPPLGLITRQVSKKLGIRSHSSFVNRIILHL